MAWLTASSYTIVKEDDLTRFLRVSPITRALRFSASWQLCLTDAQGPKSATANRVSDRYIGVPNTKTYSAATATGPSSSASVKDVRRRARLRRSRAGRESTRTSGRASDGDDLAISEFVDLAISLAFACADREVRRTRRKLTDS